MRRRSRTTRRSHGAINFEPTLHVPARHYFDLSATYTLLDRVNLRAGVNNIFDKDPPLITRAARSAKVRTSARLDRAATTPIRVCGIRWAGWCGSVRPSTSRRGSRPPPAPPPPPPPPPPAAPATMTCPDGLGDPGEPAVPGTAAAAAAAGAGSGTRPLGRRTAAEIGAAGRRPAALFFAPTNRFRLHEFALEQGP